ncbi:DegQ family serine endoprotease [Uliginosibacterium aquaticum]|uniref:Probable periplasmic serine endoprotease DegP-like n=1 Tax=Uliginosibacterium aquaticum TaxID=2731212 RepID=A0ABX2IGE9_9RHOO|nr:DegQ family serine endoprotease [Uliginosibacterium aquaticum]NSL55861.1 DegQ family serine endoprotease [Uliginosibacterium aquaticum]
MRRSFFRASLVASVATVAFTGCLQESGMPSSHASTPAVSPAAVSAARAGLPDFSGLVEAIGPAVVNISVTSIEKPSRSGFPIDENDPFFEFFRRFGIPGQGQGQQAQPRIQQGVGSGFILSADGYILTNAHVVDGASEVTVKLTDKREFKAKVIGADKRTDVALIKIDGKNLPTVKTGNPDASKPGQWVIAMGSPFGLENTVTAGIISAKARRLDGDSYVNFIQTDVAINPGNSGGPLINLDGEVIGINSQIYSRSGGYMGISFSIPIDTALKVKEQLQKHGKVSRGRLGVVIQGMDKDLAQSFGLDKPSGALVNSVEPGGPADKAGLQAGDIIQQVDGAKVEDSTDLPRIIGERNPGDSVKLKVWRDKTSRDLSVKLGEQASERVAVSNDEAATPGGKLGLVVRQLNAQEARRSGVTAGLLVEEVSGAAAKAGIRQGDLILGVSNQKVSSAEQLRKAVEAAGKSVPLLIQRGENQQYVVVRLN